MHLWLLLYIDCFLVEPLFDTFACIVNIVICICSLTTTYALVFDLEHLSDIVRCPAILHDSLLIVMFAGPTCISGIHATYNPLQI